MLLESLRKDVRMWEEKVVELESYIAKDKLMDAERDAKFSMDLRVWEDKCIILEAEVTELRRLCTYWEEECVVWKKRESECHIWETRIVELELELRGWGDKYTVLELEIH